MATIAPKRGKRGSQRSRILLALGLAAVLIVGYLWYRSRSAGTSTPATDVTGNAASQIPATDSSGAAATPDLSSLLGTLVGENQNLLDQFVKGQSDLLGSLSQLGAQQQLAQSAPTLTTPAATNFGGPEMSPLAASAPAGPAPAPAVAAAPDMTAQVVAQFGTYPTIDFTPPPPGPAPDLGPVDISAPPGPDVGGFASYPVITFTPPPATGAQVTAGQQAVNEKPVITPHGRAI